MKSERPMIGSWPTPEKPVTIEIPKKLIQEFETDIRIVIKHPWVVGIPIPELMLKHDLLKGLEGLEPMLVPR
jgi:hypothetical protein